jgi:O-antigen/teichoic acid export membrane protein
VALFAEPLLRAWTGDGPIAARTAPIATLLVIGTMFNALMHPPYALQLASGSTRLPFLLTVGQLIFMIPAVTLLALHRGAFGAAFAWPAMNALYLMVGSVATHRLWLPGAQREWLIGDVGLPMVGALIPAMIARELLPIPASRVAAIAAIGLILCGSLLASWLLSKAARPLVVQSADR